MKPVFSVKLFRRYSKSLDSPLETLLLLSQELYSNPKGKARQKKAGRPRPGAKRRIGLNVVFFKYPTSEKSKTIKWFLKYIKKILK